ncbi:hypothetical protein [Taibaiella chishuiensis]|uniref:Uncharacterized protein n=1 Tax=Taibaiella chishuiensis TaxID=1434707 RepID=A0A2P8D4D2_9BACT|nr:hypothetical protein [Taibaiella chishuiensis]PSK92029.1 hypothetical protein B0I18_104123 [Taibaiella chishuiensis]
MKGLKLMGILMTLFACSFFTSRVAAQELVSVTVEATPAAYDQMVAQNGALIESSADGLYRVVPGGGTYNPPPMPLCFDELTTAFVARMQQAANQCCCRVHFCVRRSDCAFYAMYIDPVFSPGCQPAPYQYQFHFLAYLVSQP